MIAIPASPAATLYRWVDENGRVHYSDRPQQGAETLEVEPAQTFEAPKPRATQPARRPAAAPEAAEPAEPAVSYASLAVRSPTQDQVLWNIGTVLPVALALEPALQPGHRIVLRFNGAAVDAWPGTATSGQVRDVYRGTHTVSAEIVDANGTVLKTSAPVTFYVKQTSILRN